MSEQRLNDWLANELLTALDTLARFERSKFWVLSP